MKISLASRGAEITTLSASAGEHPKLVDVQNALDSVRYDCIFMVHTETSTGVTNRDLQAICNHAKKRDTLVCVDAISGIGGEPIILSDWRIDAVAGCSQKCVGAPPGLSFVATSEEALEKCERVDEKPQYLDLSIYLDYLDRRETPFTPAVNVVRATREALLEIMEAGGMMAKWDRQRLLADILYSRSEALGIDCFVRKKEDRSNNIAAFLPPKDRSVSDIVVEIWKRGYVISQGMGKLKDSIFRVGIMGAVGKREVEGFLATLEQVLKK
jgi:aspartate aminotransferase-like enzyme